MLVIHRQIKSLIAQHVNIDKIDELLELSFESYTKHLNWLVENGHIIDSEEDGYRINDNYENIKLDDDIAESLRVACSLSPHTWFTKSDIIDRCVLDKKGIDLLPGALDKLFEKGIIKACSLGYDVK